MSEIKKLTDLILAFREERDWKQFHNPKDCAISLSLEASEVLEHFQWKTPEEIKTYIETHRDDIGEELADVFYWVLLMSHDLGIDLEDAFQKKLIKSGEKYPVDKAKGKSTKYDKL
ncbi:nucleotide pyrophosphohydrolase [Candidatus Gracilibacteria bacterium]|nr:nucleotide pyrophosphohydrolase [Candidatus Gracilibacteria bacterium]